MSDEKTIHSTTNWLPGWTLDSPPNGRDLSVYPDPNNSIAEQWRLEFMWRNEKLQPLFFRSTEICKLMDSKYSEPSPDGRFTVPSKEEIEISAELPSIIGLGWFIRNLYPKEKDDSFGLTSVCLDNGRVVFGYTSDFLTLYLHSGTGFISWCYSEFTDFAVSRQKDLNLDPFPLLIDPYGVFVYADTTDKQLIEPQVTAFRNALIEKHNFDLEMKKHNKESVPPCLSHNKKRRRDYSKLLIYLRAWDAFSIDGEIPFSLAEVLYPGSSDPADSVKKARKAASELIFKDYMYIE